MSNSRTDGRFTLLGMAAPFSLRWAGLFIPLLGAVLGGAVAVLAWGVGRTPAVSLLLPVLWILMPSRVSAFCLAATYHMVVVRFIPELAGTWFDSSLVGYSLWVGLGVISGVAWAICWPRSGSPAWVVGSSIVVMLVLLVPPVAMALPGHPLVGVGFLAPGTGWFGVGGFFVAVAGACWFFRCKMQSIVGERKWLIWSAVLALGIMLWAAGGVPDPEKGKIAGRVGALTSMWGRFPDRDSVEVMLRIGKIGLATANLAGGDDGIDTVVFPEAVLGIYDPSLYPAMEQEVLRKTKLSGQTVVVGADLESGPNTYRGVAIVFRPDGSSSYIAARMTVPVAQWAPWSNKVHFPSDWLGKSTLDVGGGIRARFMFCFEEYLPLLHLLSEAREDHVLVIAMSNLWASDDPLTSYVQGAHTEGMARLFNRKWVRSVNLAKTQ